MLLVSLLLSAVTTGTARAEDYAASTSEVINLEPTQELISVMVLTSPVPTHMRDEVFLGYEIYVIDWSKKAAYSIQSSSWILIRMEPFLRPIHGKSSRT